MRYLGAAGSFFFFSLHGYHRHIANTGHMTDCVICNLYSICSCIKRPSSAKKSIAASRDRARVLRRNFPSFTDTRRHSEITKMRIARFSRIRYNNFDLHRKGTLRQDLRTKSSFFYSSSSFYPTSLTIRYGRSLQARAIIVPLKVKKNGIERNSK